MAVDDTSELSELRGILKAHGLSLSAVKTLLRDRHSLRKERERLESEREQLEVQRKELAEQAARAESRETLAREQIVAREDRLVQQAEIQRLIWKTGLVPAARYHLERHSRVRRDKDGTAHVIALDADLNPIPSVSAEGVGETTLEEYVSGLRSDPVWREEFSPGERRAPRGD